MEYTIAANGKGDFFVHGRAAGSVRQVAGPFDCGVKAAARISELETQDEFEATREREESY